MHDQAPPDDTQPSMDEIFREMKERNAVSRARVLLAIERLREIAEAKRLLAIAEAERRRRWRLF